MNKNEVLKTDKLRTFLFESGAISSQYIASNNFQNIEVKRVQLYKESEMRRCQNSRKGVVPKKKLRLKWCVATDFSITQNMISYDLYAVLF